MTKEEMENEMEMPTPCVHCGVIFDLNDGYGSEKWHKDIVICEKCFREEELELDRDDEIEDLCLQISDAEWTIKDANKRLLELGYAAAQQNADLGGWVKCSEELPEFDVPVLVSCKIYGRWIYTYQFIGEIGGQKYGNWHDGKQLGVLPPTHWMPLPPSPPKTGDV